MKLSILATIAAGHEYYDGPCKCDLTDVLAHVTNYNLGTQFAIEGNCDYGIYYLTISLTIRGSYYSA